MSDDQRVYSDEEFALILRKAADLASHEEVKSPSVDGLTLGEMKEAAAQAGIDPALVERAARMIAITKPPTVLEWLTGGPIRHSHELRVPVRLDETLAEQLLSAIRINASLPGSKDTGHSSALGLTWHDGGALESLGVTARPEGDDTVVTVTLDRRSTLLVTTAFSSMALILTTFFAVFALYPEAPALGLGGLIAGAGGVYAIARSYWASSTRSVRERIDSVLGNVAKTLSKREAQREALYEGKPDEPDVSET